jgi:NAD+ synthase (glutamine-hydrolysing)
MSDNVTFTVTQASLNQTGFDWARNIANCFEAVDQAVAAGADLLAFDELTETGYDAGDNFQLTDNNRILAFSRDIAAYAYAKDPNLMISIGHPWRLQRRDLSTIPGIEFDIVNDPLYDRLNLPFNVQTMIGGGRILGMTAKSALYNDGRGYEKRYFNPWSVSSANRVGGVYGTIQIPLSDDGREIIPFGRAIVHVTDGKHAINIANVICEEKWVATKYDGHPHDDSRYDQHNIIPSIHRHLGSKDGLVVAISNASPPSPDKMSKHVHLNRLAARDADVVIDTDGLGTSGSTFAQFGSRMVVQGDQVISYGPRMSFGRVSTTTSTITVQSAPLETKDRAHVVLRHEFNKHGKAHVPTLAYDANPKHAWDSPNNPNRVYEEGIRNLALWLFDYMRKTGSVGITEGQSGGKDSAFNSILVHTMVRIGIDELGVEKFCDELSLPYKAKILAAHEAEGVEAAISACMENMLTSIYLASANSSAQTQYAARSLIEGGVDPKTGQAFKGIGGKYRYRNIEDLILMNNAVYAIEDTQAIDPVRKEKLLKALAEYMHIDPATMSKQELDKLLDALKAEFPEFQENPVTARDGVSYENIQARPRGGTIMIFSNKEGKMAVANPNLDEACNAYATFMGDLHSGTINLNQPAGKTFETAMLKYMQAHGLHGVMPPLACLAATLSEENPPSAELKKGFQTDESDLQRNYPQMRQIIRYMLYKRTLTGNGERRLNAGEVFDHCSRDPLFEGVSENQLYNMVRVSYKRWATAQHKIHASPIGPTWDESVDHQTSQRTPNISGECRDELVTLGIGLMFKWANEEGVNWSATDRRILERRAWQDEAFIKDFGRLVYSADGGMTYNLKKLYAKVKEQGWDNVFGPLPATHPISVIAAASPELA